MMRTACVALVSTVALSTLACAAQTPGPQIAPSSHEAVFAGSFAADLDEVGNSFASDQDEAHRTIANLGELPGKLKQPQGEWVIQIVERADKAGKSEAYVERLRKTQAAGEFFEADRDSIGGKVAGNAQYVIKQKGCNDVDVTGTITGTLKDAYGKQLQKRLRERNEAQLVIDRYRDTIPKEDVPVLEDAADDIAYASYVVNVALIDDKVRVRHFLDEANDVPKTADAYIAEETAFQAETGRTDGEKKASQARVDAMQKSKDQVAESAKQAKAAADQMDKQITEVQKQYNDAIDALKAKVRAK